MAPIRLLSSSLPNRARPLLTGLPLFCAAPRGKTSETPVVERYRAYGKCRSSAGKLETPAAQLGITFFSPPLPATGAVGPKPDAETVTSVVPLKLLPRAGAAKGPRPRGAARGWECSLLPW